MSQYNMSENRGVSNSLNMGTASETEPVSANQTYSVPDAYGERLMEQYQVISELLGDEIERGDIDPADIDYEAREQIVDYYKRSQGDQDGKEYLVRGALLRCSCGTNSRKLNLSPCHGVYFKEHPLVHKMDCKQGEGAEDNITWYGVCDQADLETEEIVVVNDHGQNQTGRKCCPEIIGSWRNTYNKAQIADNHAPSEEYELYDALTVDSYLICRHGGIITPVDSGQGREVELGEFKNGQEAYDRVVKYDKQSSVSDETGTESEESLIIDNPVNEPDNEESLLIPPNPGDSITISMGIDLENQTATVSSWNAWSLEYSVAECNKKHANDICCKRLNYAVDTYECNVPDNDLLMFNLEGYDQAVFAGAMVDGYAGIGDIVQVTLDDDSSFYLLILDTKNIHHTSAQLKENEGDSPQCQCEWGHGYMLREDCVQLCVCEFILAEGEANKIGSAINVPSGAFLEHRRVVQAQIVDHIFIDSSYAR